MATKTLHGKCPRCCPDGGACFTRTWEPNESGEFVPMKKCNCCHLLLPIRRGTKQDKPNARQQDILNTITERGWVIDKQHLIGRKVWLSAKHPRRKMWDGDSLFGTIGPCGAVEITLQRLGGDKKMCDLSELYFELRWEA